MQFTVFFFSIPGQEKDGFWNLLGGKKPYIDEFVVKDDGEQAAPRLFHGSNASGNFKRNKTDSY